MEVILLERVRKLGVLGQKVKVKAGYGRNFLIPEGIAVSATKENTQKFEARRAELEKIEAQHLKAAQTRGEALLALGAITIKAKAGEEGKLFGSVGTRDIAEIVTKAGFELQKSEVHMPLGALRNIGEYDIDVELHGDVRLVVRVNIVPEG